MSVVSIRTARQFIRWRKQISTGICPTASEKRYDALLLYLPSAEGQHIQIGLVAAASVEEYRENIIKKHELTRHDKEQDRVNHILATKHRPAAVFLTYKGKPETNTYVLSLMGAKKPVYEFYVGGRRAAHTVCGGEPDGDRRADPSV